MFAEREDLDILDYYHFIVIFIKHRPVDDFSPCQDSLSRWVPFIFSSYPFVKYSIACAYRSGVPFNPSRSGSSPKHSRISRTAFASRVCRWSLSCSVASRRAFAPAATSQVSYPRELHGQERPSRSTGVEYEDVGRDGLGTPTREILGLIPLCRVGEDGEEVDIRGRILMG